MAIKYVKFDDDDDKLKEWYTPSENMNLLLELRLFLQRLQRMGLSLEYETKLTFTPTKEKTKEIGTVSKELFMKKLYKKSNEISSYIKEVYDLDDEKIHDIDGFLSEYANKEESSLDTIKSVRNKFE